MAVVLRRSRTDPLVSGEAFTANCDSSDSVGNCVGVAGPRANGLYTVGSVDITDPATMPAIGLIIAKISPTVCVVQRHGTVSLGAPGLITGKRVFVGFDSRPTVITPSASMSSSLIAVVQIIGIAVDGSTLEVIPNPNTIQVR